MEIATIRKYKEKEKAPLKEVLQRFYFTFVFCTVTFKTYRWIIKRLDVSGNYYILYRDI